MSAEAIDLVLNGFLKSIEYKKGNDQGRESDTNARNGNLVNGRGKALRLFTAYSSRYEIGEVQLIIIFPVTMIVQSSI